MKESIDYDDIRRQLLADYDVPEAAIFYASEGLLRTEDLWWLYDEHRIMADGSAWLLAMMHDEPHDEELCELVGGFDWTWYQHGRIRPGSAQL